MASIDQVVQQIRFALENLSERNGQHEFEHLCRHFARHRICFNILPATGPVGGGGDQGKDFETFRTFIHSLGDGKFAGVGEKTKLAFACSLQKKVSSKIRSDVTTIICGSHRPDIIYFFSSRSVSVAARHKHQLWAREKHGVELEIIDGEALAEQLSDAEVFWIAARYLNVPLEIFPPLPKAGGGYDRKKIAWTKTTESPCRYSDFVELKRCARHALSNSPQDVPFWLGFLERFETSQVHGAVWSEAAYEIIVLTVRQTRSLRGQESRIRQYLSEAEKFQYPDQVENAATVTAYMVAMHRLGEIDMDPNAIHQCFLELRAKIESGIEKPASPNQLCFWLKVRGQLSLPGGVMTETLPNIAEALSWWLRVAEECSNAPTFPVQQFHDQLFDYIGLVGEHPTFDAILEKLRPEIAKRTGEAALAESHFKRAEQFIKSKQYVRGIRELHSARLKWFSDETLEKSTSCCVLLARFYSRLGLNYAAIYYSLAAGFILANAPRPSSGEELYECLATAAQAAYQQGHWCLFSGLVESLLILHSERAPKPGSLSEHEHLQWLVQTLPMASLVTQRLMPSRFDRFMNDLRRWGFGNLTEEGMKVIRPPFDKWSEDQFSKALQKSFEGPPFSDAGQKCETAWSAFGIRWRVRWDNTYEALKVAGEAVAFLQIAIAEFAGRDLDVVPGELHAEIKLTEDEKITLEPLLDNSVYRWRILAPRAPKLGRGGMNDYAEQMLTCVVRIVRAISVMPSEKFNSLIFQEVGSRVFSHGIFARRFPELIAFFLPPVRFRDDLRTTIECPIGLDGWRSATPAELEWVNSIHPSFDEATELQRIHKRYDVAIRGLQFTLRGLQGNRQFRSIVTKLRAKGWKDWHVLQAMLNAVANYRTNERLGKFAGKAEWVKAFNEESFSDEKPDSLSVPIEKFGERELERATLVTVLSTMSHLGLEPRHSTPNFEGLREYLRDRWRYWELDVQHPPVFDESSE